MRSAPVSPLFLCVLVGTAFAQAPSFDSLPSGTLGNGGDSARDFFGMRGASPGPASIPSTLPAGPAPLQAAPRLANAAPDGGLGVVRPVGQGTSEGWDGSLGAVRVKGIGGGSLDGHRVQSAGSGTLYRIDPGKGEVVVEHKITRPDGGALTYYLTYSPLAVDPSIVGKQMAPVGAGGTLGKVKGAELRVGCWRYGSAGGVVPIPINLPGVRYPDGTAPGQGKGPF